MSDHPSKETPSSIETDGNPVRKAPSSLVAWAQLVRLPNVFTVLADVSAAYLLVAHGPAPLGRFVCVLLAAIALYWAGMVLNDVFDVERDTAERANRPIPAGDISIGQASTAGWALLFVGIMLAAVSGYLPGGNAGLATTWLPGVVAVVLAIMIVAYDGPLKKTPLAPAAMGSCRVLSFLLGASPCLMLQADGLIPQADGLMPQADGLVPQANGTLIPMHVLGMACGFGIYITGITTMARREATGGRSPNLLAGFIVVLIGLAALAYAPNWTNQGGWRIRPDKDYPMLIGLISLPIIYRGIRVLSNPVPATIQNMIRTGILSIIPLSAAIAFLGAGQVAGLCVLGLFLPATFLANWLRVT